MVGARHDDHRGPVAQAVRTLAEVIRRIMEETIHSVGGKPMVNVEAFNQDAQEARCGDFRTPVDRENQ